MVSDRGHKEITRRSLQGSTLMTDGNSIWDQLFHMGYSGLTDRHGGLGRDSHILYHHELCV